MSREGGEKDHEFAFGLAEFECLRHPPVRDRSHFCRALRLFQLSPSLGKRIENYKYQSRYWTLGGAPAREGPEV